MVLMVKNYLKLLLPECSVFSLEFEEAPRNDVYKEWMNHTGLSETNPASLKHICYEKNFKDNEIPQHTSPCVLAKHRCEQLQNYLCA